MNSKNQNKNLNNYVGNIIIILVTILIIISHVQAQVSPFHVEDIAWSSDGELFAVAGGDYQCGLGIQAYGIQIFDASTETLLHTLEGHTCTVITIEWSPNGNYLVSGGLDGVARVWDITTGNLISVTDIVSPDGRVNQSWSPDGLLIADVYGSNSTVHIWHSMTGQPASVYESNERISSHVWNSDVNNSIIAIGVFNGVHLLDPDTMLVTESLNTSIPAGDINKLAWSSDNSLLAGGSADGTIYIWDTTTGSEVALLLGHTTPIFDIAWNAGGTAIASGADLTVRVWDVTTSEQVEQYVTQSSPSAVDWKPNGTQIAFSGNSQSNSVMGVDIIPAPTLSSCDSTIITSDTASLISAINTGNNAGSAYTICLENSKYSFTSSNNSDGYGANALPIITGDITIIGNGATIERDVTAPDFRLFRVENGGSLTLENLTLQNGVTSGTGASGDGGAIHNRGTLSLVDTTVINNTANVEGGAIYNDTNAVISITDSIISNNTALADDGGAIDNHGSLVISGSTLEYNSSTNDDGGAIWNDSNATLSITDSILRYNTANDFGGAIRTFGTVTINNSNIDNNTANQDGGAISSDTGVVTITDGSLNNNSAVNDDGGAIITFAPLSLNNVTIDGNSSGDKGGAIYAFGTDLIIENQTIFSNNSAGHNGGALYTGSGSSTLSITDSTFSSNTTPQHGGALYLDNGTHTISNSLFQSNTSVKRGGAIFTYGNLTINLNTIFDANQASDDGGAIYANDTITVTDSTFRFNSATDQGGAVRGYVSNSSFLVNSCIHDNVAGNTSGLYFASSNFDASYNWWGATDGASGSGSGSGDEVNNNVEYSNFITTTCVDAFGANGMTVQSLAVASSNNTVQSQNSVSENIEDSGTYPVVRSSYENNFDADETWFGTVRWQRDELAGRTGGAWILDSNVRGQSSTLEMTTWVDLANNPQIRLEYADQAQLSSGDITTLEIQVQGSSDWVVLSQSIGGSYSWQDRSVSLSAYRGQTVRLRWRVDVSADIPLGESSAYYVIDDVAITRR